MLTTRRNRPAPPKPQRLSLRDWQKGYISAQGANRTPGNGLRNALNTILSQDGTVKPRPSLVRYGTQPTGTILGKPEEFVRRESGVPVTYLVTMQVVAGVAKVYVQKDGGAWTVCNGKTFNTTAEPHFCPVRDVDSSYNDEDKVLITNGEDTLAYLDINTLTVVPFTALAGTSAPTLSVGSGLTGTNFNHRYRVTASNRGETAASTTTVATTTKIRESWSGATEYIDVTITRVTGATRYHIYYGATIGEEQYLFSIDDPGSGATVTWRDTGTIAPDPYRTAPLGDTTAGPICTRASFINGQVFLVGDKNNPKYVRYGGTGTSLLDFSPYGGGGYQPVGGNKEFPQIVKAFRENSGTPAITILCNEKRYIFSPQSTTIGTTIISYFAVREENGADGTIAPDSVLLARDQLWYFSGDEFSTTLTKPQVQTILSTEGVSDLIQPDVQRLNRNYMSKCRGLVNDNRLYWSMPVGDSRNTEIWSLDLSDLRRGAWMRPWNVQADHIWIYRDNSGSKHFCILSNNVIYEFTESVATADDGASFSTGISTGILKFSKDGQEYANVLRVIYVLQNPAGNIAASVTGLTEDDTAAGSVGSGSYSSESVIVGWDEPVGWDGYGWEVITEVPQAFGLERTEIEIEIDEELKWLSCDLTSSSSGVSYELTDIIVEYINVGTKY